MEFEMMLTHLKKYKKDYPDGNFAARRGDWNERFYVFIGDDELDQPAKCLKFTAGMDMIALYYPRQEDMFADDWEVFNKS